MKLVDELGILKCCKNCDAYEYCKDSPTLNKLQCTQQRYAGFRPSENALKVRCGELILERDKAMEKLTKAEAIIKELNRIHTKRLKECRKLWKKQTERKNDVKKDSI